MVKVQLIWRYSVSFVSDKTFAKGQCRPPCRYFHITLEIRQYFAENHKIYTKTT